MAWAGITFACLCDGPLAMKFSCAISINTVMCRTPAQLLAKEREVEMGKEDLANKPEAIRWGGWGCRVCGRHNVLAGLVYAASGAELQAGGPDRW